LTDRISAAPAANRDAFDGARDVANLAGAPCFASGTG
jgi:hypothetical protein